jgi:AGZA family xanthine/uracil permease-like MFS transporter
VRHYPALALAVLPTLAYLALMAIDLALGGRAPTAEALPAVQSLRCLANGFILTSLLWAAALASLLDGKLIRAAAYLAVAGLASLFGIIHSPLASAVIALPNHVLAQMSRDPAILCQSPYHWAAAYGLAAATLLLLSGITRDSRPSPL